MSAHASTVAVVESGDQIVITIAGAVGREQGDALAHAVTSLLARDGDPLTIVLDLADLGGMDAAGLRSMIDVVDAVTAADGSISLRNVPRRAVARLAAAGMRGRERGDEGDPRAALRGNADKVVATLADGTVVLSAYRSDDAGAPEHVYRAISASGQTLGEFARLRDLAAFLPVG